MKSLQFGKRKSLHPVALWRGSDHHAAGVPVPANGQQGHRLQVLAVSTG